LSSENDTLRDGVDGFGLTSNPRDALLAQQLAVLVERGGVWEALWGSTPIITGMGAPFSRANRGNRGGQATLDWADLCGATPGQVPAGPHNRS
jgi:hypothetical protein